MTRILPYVLLLLTLGSCGAVRMEESDWHGRTSELAQQQVLGDQSIDAGERSYLQGPLVCGSQALYRVEWSRGEEASERWELEITAPRSPKDREGSLIVWSAADRPEGEHRLGFRAALYEGLISVRPEEGAAEESAARLALGFLKQGFDASCEAFSESQEGQEWTAELGERLGVEGCAIISMSTIANENKAARGLLMRVVQFPSWWTWLVPTVNVSFKPAFHEAERVETPLGPGWRFPVELTIKGDPAFYARVTAIEPTGVLEMTAGIVEAVGFAPDRPDEPVRLHLVGARGPTAIEIGGEQVKADIPIRAGYSME